VTNSRKIQEFIGRAEKLDLGNSSYVDLGIYGDASVDGHPGCIKFRKERYHLSMDDRKKYDFLNSKFNGIEEK